jgi:Lamin Tail Domain
MKARLAGLFAALTVAAGTVLTGAVPAQAAAPAVQFTRIQFNSPGSDTRTNASLNAEWVRLTNKTKKTISLKNWTVRDRAGKIYKFPAYNLGAAKNVYIHTGKGTNGKPAAADRYWQSGNYIWNNTGDKATLKNTKKSTIDTCSWKSVTATNC